MPPRSSWKGFLRLSLVSVPVKAYTANATGSEIRLNQLHDGCHNRVKYQKVCPEHGNLQADEIVSGYEYSKGQYVVIDTDELSKLRTESDKCINIDGFINRDTLDPIYHAGKTYFLLPDGAVGQKPYGLMLQAMEQEDIVALAQLVIAGKEQVVMVRPSEGLLLMTVLNHRGRIKSGQSFKDELVSSNFSDEEMKLTKTLIGASMIEEFDYGRYEDVYTQRLTKLIEAKVEGQEIVQVKDQEEPKIMNLMEALKESVAKARQASDAPAPRKKAPSTKKIASRGKKKASSTRSKTTAKRKKKTG